MWRTFLCLLLLVHEGLGFGILPGKSQNHLDITEAAIFNITVETCRAVSQAAGNDFTAPTPPFTASSVAAACRASKSSKKYQSNIVAIRLWNVRVDLRHVLNASFHFDDENFLQGRAIITAGLQATKAANRQENYEAARKELGTIMHPLQDFYSHSDWVEIKNIYPNANLIRSDTSVGNIAAESRATCRSCEGDDCRDNILQDVIDNKVLTSGYFVLVPLPGEKPAGKCSHGGAVDSSSSKDPKGGINKDSLDASHGHLHTKAADLATAATSQLLEDVRAAAGDEQFLEMLGISKGSGRALCLVIDVTKSMSDDIQTIRDVTSSIIDQAGSLNAPSLYILVPFSDPDVGPLQKTSDPEVFKNRINALTASGGGDEAERSLAGLQMALDAAPKNSELFLFTDAPAKDKELSSNVLALMERKQTVVNFLVTNSTSSNKAGAATKEVSQADLEVYRKLSQASGGQTIEVLKTDLQSVANSLIETSTTSVVTLLQVSRSPGKTEEFLFRTDQTVSGTTVFITGTSLTVTATSPSGTSQQSGSSGSIITSSQTAGNFMTLKLKTEAGEWKIKMESSNTYTLKVIGQSDLDFLFDFVQSSSGVVEGFDSLDSRPQAGVNGSLLVTRTGSDVATVTEVTLVESSGSGSASGSVAPQGDGNFLATFSSVPLGSFAVTVKGSVDGSKTSHAFQRQSPTNFRGSNLTLTADADAIIVPGGPFSVPFTVKSSSAGGNLTVRASNSRNFASTSPSSLLVDGGGGSNGTVTLTVPLNTPSGTDVGLVIEVEWPSGEDSNYVAMRFTIVNTVTDFTAPVCKLVSLQKCPTNVADPEWTVSVRVTDGADGTGVERVSLRQGNGTLLTQLDPGDGNVTLADYNATCSAPDAELLLVDRVGNVGSCLLNSEVGVVGASRVLRGHVTLVALGLVALNRLL